MKFLIMHIRTGNTKTGNEPALRKTSVYHDNIIISVIVCVNGTVVLPLPV